MPRLPSRVVPGPWALLVLSMAAAAPAGAEPSASPPTGPTGSTTIDGLPGRRIAVDTPIDFYATPAAQVSPIIYLDRCQPECTVTAGNNDARINSSSIPKVATATIKEFRNSALKIGAEADAEWSQVVQCVREVYSPYNVMVTDVLPTGGQGFHKAIVAGNPADIGYGPDILGVAPLAGDCSAIDNVISFTFANSHAGTPATANERILAICWTAAQESAHAYGLDHEYQFTDYTLTPNNGSACNDPMTYRTDCGGQKFFRNASAKCGETGMSRPCKCGATQNSHLKVLSVFGAGMPITGSPTITLTDPTLGGGTLSKGVSAMASSKRGVARIELFFNGYKWAEVPGAQFGLKGQPAPSAYTALVPAALPNSIVDVKMIAYDDLGAATETSVVTVTRGAPCDTADTCAGGQKCEAGKCFWDPPVGEVGDSCTFPQFCKSGLCTGTSDQQICTQDCIPGVADSCPMGLECVMSSANSGVCFFATSGGCCSVDRSDRAWWVQLALAAALLGYLGRRRRR
jgi:MYXO-CTERM domain-containing protein